MSDFCFFFMINLRAYKRFLWDILSGLLSHHFSSLITQLMTSQESKVPHYCPGENERYGEHVVGLLGVGQGGWQK